MVIKTPEQISSLVYAPQISPNGNLTLSLDFTVPLTAHTGNYTLVETVQWQYLENFPKIWWDGGMASAQSHIHLAGTNSNVGGSGPGSNPNTSSTPSQTILRLPALAGLIIPAIAILFAAGLIAILAIILLRRRPNPTAPAFTASLLFIVGTRYASTR